MKLLTFKEMLKMKDGQIFYYKLTSNSEMEPMKLIKFDFDIYYSNDVYAICFLYKDRIRIMLNDNSFMGENRSFVFYPESDEEESSILFEIIKLSN